MILKAYPHVVIKFLERNAVGGVWPRFISHYSQVCSMSWLYCTLRAEYIIVQFSST